MTEELIQYTLGQKQAGKEYDEIQRKLTEDGIDDQTIKEIIRAADDLYLDELKEQGEDIDRAERGESRSDDIENGEVKDGDGDEN